MNSKQTGGEAQSVAPSGERFRNWPWRRRLVQLLVAVIIFGLGLSIGNGTISLSSKHGVSGNLPATPDYTSVTQVYRSLIQNYNGKLTETQLENGLKHGLAQATNDPYTEYFTPAEAKAFN